MAEDFKERRRREEKEEAARESERLEAERARKKPGARSLAPVTASGEKFEELILRAEPMIEQLNSLYNMWASGAEKIPPIERRKQLDQVMATLTLMSKPSSAAQFRFSSVNNTYITFRDRWERMIRDMESGKIKRR